LPGPTRSGPISRITSQFRSALDDHRHTGVDISVIAHSFGSYIVAEILLRNPDISLKRLILCGSVVAEKFDWFRVKGQVEGVAINDCGSRDIWPVFAKSITWGYGPTGTYGFKVDSVEDRVHPFRHSDYFTDTFVRRFSLPVLRSGEAVPTNYKQDSLRYPAIITLADFYR